MKAIILFTILTFLGISDGTAQYFSGQNKVWVFGHNAGIDFTSGTPVPFTSGIFTNEGSASVSDAAGHLLFYTDGTTIYNRTGAIMPGGASVVSFSTTSTTNAAVIIPVPSTTTQYYVFSLEAEGVVGCSRLAYTIVDMTLDGGFGDVVPGSVGISYGSLFSEKMIAIQGEGCNVWLLTHKRSTNEFHAFNITATGIGSPVISNFPVAGAYTCGIGAMVCSPDRTKIAIQYNLSVPSGTELFDFDVTTGIVSHQQVLETGRMCYGAEFSPDNSKLYTQYYDYPSTVQQYDLSLPTLPAIVASRTVVGVGLNGFVSQLRLGPDSKIYLNGITSVFANHLDVINYPNLPGGSCGYSYNAITLPVGVHGAIGLPNLYVAPGFFVDATYRNDTLACIPPGTSINIHPHISALQYLWNNGDTSYNHNVTATGQYWVQAQSGCSAQVDTINVIPDLDTISRVVDTGLCFHSDADSFQISIPGAYDYYWDDGTTDSSRLVFHPIDLWVGYTIDCTRYSDTFHLHYYPAAGPIIGPDTICVGSSATLSAPTTGGTWISGTTSIASIGITDGIVTGLSAGYALITYTALQGCKDARIITVLPLPCNTGLTQTLAAPDGVELFPNPATSEFTISFTGTPPTSAHISIYDITGRVLHTYPLKGANTTLSISDLAPGMYQCHIDVDGAASVSRKLVVIR